jgi:hypothetical protein
MILIIIYCWNFGFFITVQNTMSAMEAVAAIKTNAFFLCSLSPHSNEVHKAIDEALYEGKHRNILSNDSHILSLSHYCKKDQ